MSLQRLASAVEALLLPPHELIEVRVKHVLLNPLHPLELGLHTISA